MKTKKIFQSTFPRGERLCPTFSLRIASPFQSTFPRGERQFIPFDKLSVIKISIHVPAWGTTLCAHLCKKRQADFNPRSRVGNDAGGHTHTNNRRNFNPRSRVGNDQYSTRSCTRHNNFNPRSRVGNDTILRIQNVYKMISIHVPAWGTTKYNLCYPFASFNFNPRSRVGNDGTEQKTRHKHKKFQSTFPRGERL